MTALRWEPGQILNNRYRIEALLGQGGMGQVFLSRDLSTGGRVALKTFRDAFDETDRRRFEREIRTLGTLEHAHIVPFRELGVAGETLFFTMDYVPGVTLEEVLAGQHGVTSPAELDWVLAVTAQITKALGYLHGLRLVHRDVKPSNVLLTLPQVSDSPLPPASRWWHESSVTAFLTDFGLVKTREGDGSLTRAALGTPHYMSPEQVAASPAVDERSDLYSLGVILYRAVTGQLPFPLLTDVLSRDPAPPLRAINEQLPELLDNVVARLLEYEPYRRPGSADEVIELLGAVLDRKGERTVEAVAISKTAQPMFCGRESELQLLKKATQDATRGQGRWVSITGERGTGKTWLLARSDFKTQSRMRERMGFYSGAFSPSAPHAGFQEVLIGVLRRLDRAHGPDGVAESLGRWGGHLKTLFPLLAGEGWLETCPRIEEGVPTDILKERVFETVVGLLTRFAEVEPRILVFEDLHYGDDFDIELLRRLVINSIQLPVLVITSHRQEFQGRLPGLERLLHEIRCEERLLELEMQPFRDADVRTMVSSMLVPSREIPDSFVRVLQERTDGVPLYLLHLLNSLWNRGMVELEGNQWQVDPERVRSLPIPESTRSHFLLVLDEIPAEQRRVLNIAAILGTQFSFDVLLEVLKMDEFELDAICRNLVHAGILEEHQADLRFLHTFEQEIVVSCLSQAMYRRLHARVGKFLEAHYGDDLDKHIGEVAEHMFLGGEADSGARYLRRAAEQAEGSYAPRAAIEFLRKALELSHDGIDRRALLTRIGNLFLDIGELESALVHFREAMLHFSQAEGLLLERSVVLEPEKERELASYAQLLVSFGEVYGRQGDFDIALENFEKAERISRRINDPGGIAFALVRQGGTHMHREDFSRADDAYRASVEFYKNLPPSKGLVSALVGSGLVERMRGDLETALEFTTEALKITQAMKDRLQTAKLLNSFGNLYRFMGRLHEAVQSFEQSIEIREQLGDRQGLAVCLMNLGRLRADLGDFRASLEALSRALEIFQAIGDKRGVFLTVGNLGSAHFYLGDFATARSYFEGYLRDARLLDAPRAIGDALHCLATVEYEVNHLEAAEAYIEESISHLERAGDQLGVIRGHVQLARVRGRQQDYEAALDLCRKVEERAGAMENPESLAEALRVAAEIHRTRGDLEKAAELGNRALRHYEELNFPYHQGVCCRTLGKIYRDLGYLWADQTSKYFGRALRNFELLGARYAAAVTQLEYGIFLGLVDEVAKAEELFLKARPVFEELATVHELQRVQNEIAELR